MVLWRLRTGASDDRQGRCGRAAETAGFHDRSVGADHRIVQRRLTMPTDTTTRPSLPPRWFIRTFWQAHRALVGVTGGRVGLWRPKPGKWGAMWLTTVGRRSGEERRVVLGYFEDGPNLVTMAMNGWGAPEPAWWLNLQAHPAAEIRVVGGSRRVIARAAEGDERKRLWARWGEIDENLEGYAALRPRDTAVVVFEPAG
jgi:F420H(2)-dependent quinone reductase